MISERFKELISFIVSCNGTGKAELQKRIMAGELTEEEATMVELYANVQKLHNRLDALNTHTDQLFI